MNFLNGSFTASVYKRSDIKNLAGVVENILHDRTGRSFKNVTEYIVKFQVGNSPTVLSTIFLTGGHIGEFGKVAELADIREKDKAGLYPVTHEQSADPFSVFAIGLAPLLGVGIFGTEKDNKAGFQRDHLSW